MIFFFFLPLLQGRDNILIKCKKFSVDLSINNVNIYSLHKKRKETYPSEKLKSQSSIGRGIIFPIFSYKTEKKI